MNERRRMQLEAYRDGELSWLGRWRVQRWLRRDPAARRQLEALDALGALLRDVDAGGPAPDLWPAIRVRIAAADAPAPGRVPGVLWGRGAGYLAAGAVAASAAALALVLGGGEPAPRALSLGGEEPAPRSAPSGAVRWIDSRGHPMMVLRNDAAATIIWVPEQAL